MVPPVSRAALAVILSIWVGGELRVAVVTTMDSMMNKLNGWQWLIHSKLNDDWYGMIANQLDVVRKNGWQLYLKVANQSIRDHADVWNDQKCLNISSYALFIIRMFGR